MPLKVRGTKDHWDDDKSTIQRWNDEVVKCTGEKLGRFRCYWNCMRRTWLPGNRARSSNAEPGRFWASARQRSYQYHQVVTQHRRRVGTPLDMWCGRPRKPRHNQMPEKMSNLINWPWSDSGDRRHKPRVRPLDTRLRFSRAGRDGQPNFRVHRTRPSSLYVHDLRSPKTYRCYSFSCYTHPHEVH